MKKLKKLIDAVMLPSHAKWMFLNNFRNNMKLRVEARLWNSQFLGHGTCLDLYLEFSKSVESLDS